MITTRPPQPTASGGMHSIIVVGQTGQWGGTVVSDNIVVTIVQTIVDVMPIEQMMAAVVTFITNAVAAAMAAGSVADWRPNIVEDFVATAMQ